MKMVGQITFNNSTDINMHVGYINFAYILLNIGLPGMLLACMEISLTFFSRDYLLEYFCIIVTYIYALFTD